MSIIEQHLRVAIYIRVSTKLQEDRYSLSAQKTELVRYAKAQNWTIVDIFKDVDSGGKLDKVGLESLLDCVEDGLVDVVLVIEQDRLSRLDTVDWEYLKDVLRRNRVKIAEPGNIIDLTNEDDEFISDIKNVIAKRERRSIKRKMNRGIRQYTREGKLYGRQPDEYIFDSNSKTVSVNEERAWIIPYIDRLFLEEGKSMHKIAQSLNPLTLTANGAFWSATQIKNRLVSKVYHGVLEKTFLNGETIIVENAYPPLRTKETWEKIQIRLKQIEAFPSPATYNHSLRQIKIVCGSCGRILSLMRGPSYEDGSFNVYVAHARHNYTVDCDVRPSYNAVQITRPLFQLIKSILLDSDAIGQYLESYQNEITNIEALESQVKAIQMKIENNTVRLDKLLTLYLDGAWSKEKLDEKKERIEEENSKLSDQMVSDLRKLELVKRGKYNMESYLEVIGDVEEYLAIFMRMEENDEMLPVELNELDREKLVSKMFDKLVINPFNNQATIYGKSVENVPIPFNFDVDDENLAAIDKLRRRQRERYLNTQRIIDEQPHPIGFMELKRITGLNAQTLNEDAKLFGPYKGMKLKKGSQELKEQAIQAIKDCLKEDIKMPSVDIAKRANINPSTVLKYIREYQLRPTGGPRGPYKKK